MTITATARTSFVKLYNYRTKQSLLFAANGSEGAQRSFEAYVPIESAVDSYYFKAYASASEQFSAGGTVLKFTHESTVTDIALSCADTPCLYIDGKLHALSASFYPTNASSGKQLHYTSSDTSVVSVTAAGKMRAVGYGSAVITAENENGLQARYPVTVLPPQMSEPTVTENDLPKPSTIELDTKGASDIELRRWDGSEVPFTYTSTLTASDNPDYDTHWVVTLDLNESEATPLKVYATDNAGIKENTPFMLTTVHPRAALKDFQFSEEEYVFSRTAGALTLSLNTTPQKATGSFEWSISDESVATIEADGDSCLLTPHGAGTAILSASAEIDGETITRSAFVTFESGQIYDVTFESNTLQCYDIFEVQVTTSQSVTGVRLTDATNSLSESYSDPAFFTDTDDYRIWTLPFCFKRESKRLKVSATDALGESASKTYAVTVSMPASGIATSSALIQGEVGTLGTCNLITLPSRANISTLRYTAQMEDESIATFNLANVRFLKEGVTTLHFYYNGEQRDVTVYSRLSVKSIQPKLASKYLEIGESYQVEATTTPASSQRLFYSSSQPKIASVNNAGVVTARSVGTATIHISAFSGASASFTVKVSKHEAGGDDIAFDKMQYTAKAGETIPYALNKDGEITLISSNPKVVALDNTQSFQAIKEGSATIYAMEDSEHIASAKVTVHANRHLSLSKAFAEIPVHESFLLTASLAPAAADLDGYWYSDNCKVATVEQNGMVYAKSAGSCHICYISERGEIAACEVLVSVPQLEDIQIYDSEIKLGVGARHIVLYTTGDAVTTGEITWSSEDEAVAAVDKNGVVYGIGAGRTLINLTLPNGKSYALYVTVSSQSTRTVRGKVNAPATLTLYDASGHATEYAVNSNFLLDNIPADTACALLNAPNYTNVRIEEIDAIEDINLGTLTLHEGDINHDGSVGIDDISLLLKSANFGQSATARPRSRYDLYRDEVLDIKDVSQILLAQNYGGCNQTIVY